MTQKSKFGKRLAYLRIEHNLSQRAFATKIGFSQELQSQIESGKRSPSPAYVIAIDNAFQFSMEEGQEWHRAACLQIGWLI